MAMAELRHFLPLTFLQISLGGPVGVSISVGVTVMNHGGLLFLVVHRRWRGRGRRLLKHADILWGRRRRRGWAVRYWVETEGEKIKTLWRKNFTHKTSEPLYFDTESLIPVSIPTVEHLGGFIVLLLFANANPVYFTFCITLHLA